MRGVIIGILSLAILCSELCDGSRCYVSALDIHLYGDVYIIEVHDFYYQFIGILVYHRIGIEHIGVAYLNVVYEFPVNEGTYLRVTHFDAYVIPASLLNRSCSGLCGALRCCHCGLNAMEGIAPSSEVEPLEVEPLDVEPLDVEPLEELFNLATALESASRVLGPATPSTVSPFFVWKDLRAESVPSPNDTSIVP